MSEYSADSLFTVPFPRSLARYGICEIEYINSKATKNVRFTHPKNKGNRSGRPSRALFRPRTTQNIHHKMIAACVYYLYSARHKFNIHAPTSRVPNYSSNRRTTFPILSCRREERIYEESTCVPQTTSSGRTRAPPETPRAMQHG